MYMFHSGTTVDGILRRYKIRNIRRESLEDFSYPYLKYSEYTSWLTVVV